MHHSSRSLLVAFGLAAITAAPIASAQLLTAVDQGNYDQFGFSDPEFTGYVAGIFETNPEFRNFFIFDRSLVRGPITSATLEIFNPAPSPDFDLAGYVSRSLTETYSLYDVTTELSGLIGGTTDAFEDLGTGLLYGSSTVSAANNGQWISITLNAAFLAAINSGTDHIAIGGALTTLDDPDGLELIFADSGSAPLARLTLIPSGSHPIQPIPEPSTYGLMGAALLLVGATVRKRRTARS